MKRGTNKKGALELSISTVVIVVIAMTMLVLGLALVRNIFSGASDSVNEINDRVKDQIKNLFEQSGEEVIVRLGSQNSANVRQGTNNFGFVFAVAPDPKQVASHTTLCDYSITTVDTPNNCDALDGVVDKSPLNWITSGTTTRPFDKSDANIIYALVTMNIPNLQPCNQRFSLSINCDATTGVGAVPAFPRTNYFQINIIKKGFFS